MFPYPEVEGENCTLKSFVFAKIRIFLLLMNLFPLFFSDSGFFRPSCHCIVFFFVRSLNHTPFASSNNQLSYLY